ncbi:hypothetical protein AAG906_015272 [Vitis piasezkii]
MEEAKTMKTSMSSSIKLDKDEKGGRRQLLGLRASTLLSHLNLIRRRLVERRAVMISEPIFPTLVRAFFSQVTYGLGGPIISTVRDVEIRLSPEIICYIFNIPSVGLKVYESKTWPTVPGFEPREAIQRILTVISRVLHHMIYEVSYLEAFLIDSILTGRQIHVGYLMMMHMISCCKSTTRVFPYDRFLTRQSLGRMKFEKALDGSWIRRAERPPAQAQGQGQMHPGIKEAQIREMESGLDPHRVFEHRGPKLDIPHLPQSKGIQFEAIFSESMMFEPIYTAGPSSQPSFTEFPHIEIPSQAPHAPDRASLGTRMEELVVVSDTRFYSIEDRMDQY